VIDSDLEETHDEIDEATTSLIYSPRAHLVAASARSNAAPSKVGSSTSSSRPPLWSFNLSDLYSRSGGLMPAFPAGKVPFILAAAVACFSLVAVVLTVVWGQQVGLTSLLFL